METKFWSDDFDIDLSKVVPNARQIIGNLSDVKLKTHCSTAINEKLNHPDVWNHELGFISFFGFDGPSKPPICYTNSPIIECTFWEAIRDAWCHDICIIVEGRPVWNALPLREQFHKIMYHIRKINPVSEQELQAAIADVELSLYDAVKIFAQVVRRYGIIIDSTNQELLR